MAFRDIETVMYDGKIMIEYRDKQHSYWRHDLQPDGSWGPAKRVRGTTTILGDTLEKKGLMTWPLGLALTELFGFYDFETEDGERKVGLHGKKRGTLLDANGELLHPSKHGLLPLVQSASKAWTRKQKQGADIGSLVHDAIEQFVNGTPFDLTLERYKEGQEFATSTEEAEWDAKAEEELAMAKAAYGQFLAWWEITKPTLMEAENVVYSREGNYCGSYDARLGIQPAHHPVYKDWDRPIIVMADWKTSNASVAGGAPMGVYYSYFIQDAAYAKALYEMTGELVDDLLVVSARKDGTFDTVYASEVGLSVKDAIAWWDAVCLCNVLMNKTKRGLVELAKGGN